MMKMPSRVMTMGLELDGFIALPAHAAAGGFDHAAVHRTRARLYVAHTGNDALDVMDCENETYLYSVPNLAGVAGALVSEERDLVFTSNRRENTVGIIAPDDEANPVKVGVGIRPNGLAFDPVRGLLLAANVGDPAVPNSCTVSIVDVVAQKRLADIPVPGRTRWTLFDPQANAFYVNIAAPAQIVVIDANTPDNIANILDVPAAGPHGLDLDSEKRRLFCACDARKLIVLELPMGTILGRYELSGSPDVIFFNPALRHLYVACGDPGVIDVFETDTMAKTQVVTTERGAHTLGFDAQRNQVYAFMPESHRAAVFVERATLEQ